MVLLISATTETSRLCTTSTPIYLASRNKSGNKKSPAPRSTTVLPAVSVRYFLKNSKLCRRHVDHDLPCMVISISPESSLAPFIFSIKFKVIFTSCHVKPQVGYRPLVLVRPSQIFSNQTSELAIVMRRARSFGPQNIKDVFRFVLKRLSNIISQPWTIRRKIHKDNWFIEQNR